MKYRIFTLKSTPDLGISEVSTNDRASFLLLLPLDPELMLLVPAGCWLVRLTTHTVNAYMISVYISF